MQGISSLFDWIVLSSLMGSILVILILVLKFAFKSTLSANWHYYIWVLLLFRLIIPFAPESPLSMYNLVKIDSLKSSFSNQTDSLTEVRVPTETADSNSKLIDNTVPGASNPVSIKNDIHSKSFAINAKTNWEISFIVFWLIGIALLFGYTLIINVRFWYQIRRAPKTNNSSLINIVDNCKSELKIIKDIPVIITNKVRTPALFGPIKPLLLIPDSCIKVLSDTELKYIVLHEFVHWKRKDIILNWITVVVQIVHWFNPIIWYGFYRMHQDCEHACDARVLSSLDLEKHKEYGLTIIRVLEMMLAPQWIPGTPRMLSQKSDIKRRIRMISKFKKGSLPISFIAILLFIAVGIVGCTNPLNLNSLQFINNTAKSTYNQKLQDQMMAGSVDVEGPGIIVTLVDGDSLNDNAQRVHDADLQDVITKLIAAGAEAISVNGERLIATSSINVSSNSILINRNLYSSPFVIKAIGDSDMMLTTLDSKGGVAELLKAYGIKITMNKSKNISIPKYKGEVNFKYAKPVEK